MGNYFLSQLKTLQQKYKIIKGVRGKGLMLAVELSIEADDIVNKCLHRGLLINSTGGKTIRFVPPLIITAQDVDQAIKVLKDVMEGK
jgi:acetylornithine/succinyldiaminopimelate/putrescine aminotransferase